MQVLKRQRFAKAPSMWAAAVTAVVRFLVQVCMCLPDRGVPSGVKEVILWLVVWFGVYSRLCAHGLTCLGAHLGMRIAGTAGLQHGSIVEYALVFVHALLHVGRVVVACGGCACV